MIVTGLTVPNMITRKCDSTTWYEANMQLCDTVSYTATHSEPLIWDVRVFRDIKMQA